MRSFYFSLLLIICWHGTRSQQTADTLLIRFDFNQASLSTPATATLDSFLQLNPLATITQIFITGHCDFIGSHQYNDSLSQERAKATRAYLEGKGCSPTLFGQATGLGKRQPLELAETDAARAINRRVEIIIIKQAIVKVPPPQEVPVTSKTESRLSAMIRDTAIKAGSTLVLPNLNFEPGRHFLLSGSYAILRELYKVMKDNPTLQIEIHGHICCISGGADGPDVDTGAPDLSVQRAKAIYQYLLSAGIAANRMSYKGFGSSQKLFPSERTPMEETKNRRVEIKIISK
ncbi:OmpA family protein [Paraflavitalea speifideaquila]|uniref:OmpA family protein n=1 Tax=Paraflavitalea speifideaquila TaxID=3076558 RepID=UPI0028E7C223|nr:OmpA family protein [Paraflavitalea speifideiaquila]